MKNTTNILISLIMALGIFSGCEKPLDEPVAVFRIEKDTIINSVKTRIETNYADTINPVYFVFEGSANFNSVWPGDTIIMPDLSVRTPPTGQIVKVPYSIIQDYDSRADSVLLNYSRNDSLNTQYKIVYQGIALPYGTSEIQYTYQKTSKVPLTVTWVSASANYSETKTSVFQKSIIVK
jgi:hypothetical protein